MTGGSQCAGSGWGWPKATMRIALLSGHGQDEQATSVVSWLGAWSDALRWRCPPLDARRPVASVAIGQAVTLDWGVRPTGQSAGAAMSVGRPGTARCPQEELIVGDGVR